MSKNSKQFDRVLSEFSRRSRTDEDTLLYFLSSELERALEARLSPQDLRLQTLTDELRGIELESRQLAADIGAIEQTIEAKRKKQQAAIDAENRRLAAREAQIADQLAAATLRLKERTELIDRKRSELDDIKTQISAKEQELATAKEQLEVTKVQFRQLAKEEKTVSFDSMMIKSKFRQKHDIDYRRISIILSVITALGIVTGVALVLLKLR